MPRHTRRAVVAGLGAVGLAGCTGRLTDGNDVTETTTRTLSAVPTTVSVTNDVGDVSVTTAERSDVQIELTRRGAESQLDRLEFAVERDDGDVTLVGGRDDDRLLRNDAELSLTIDVTLPTGVAVERVETTVGDTRLVGVDGDPTIESTVGDVTVRETDGYVTVETTTGDVTVRDVAGIDGAQATTGDVTLDVSSLRSDTSVTTTTGDVTLALAPDLDAAVSVAADAGDVTVAELPLGVTETTAGASADGTLGGGTHRLTVETNVGTVELHPLSA